MNDWSARVRTILTLIRWEADSHYIQRSQLLQLSTKISPLLSSSLVKACWKWINISLARQQAPPPIREKCPGKIILWYCNYLLLHILDVSCRRYKAPLHWCIWNHIRAMSSLHTVRNILLSSVNTASGWAGWTVSSSAGPWQLVSLSTMLSWLLSALPHLLCLPGVDPFGCRVCLQVPCTGPQSGLCLHSQQNTHPPTSQNHLKIDPEHPKTDTSCFIHTACAIAAQERLTALQTTSTGAWIWPLSSRVLIHSYTHAKKQQSGQSNQRAWQI